MFHCFIIREDNRNFLRFRWYRNNDVNDEVVDYRMKVHVFGNSPSPAVAIFGLRKTAQIGEQEFGSDARQFVERNFYVDDGLKSLPTEEEAIDLLTRTQNMLATANLRLHKIISNSNEVMRAVGFVMGKAKLTPKPAHTIPRLELCAAVLAVEIAELIKHDIDFHIDSFDFYTDSRIVLGYIHNQTRQFHVYVGNRVERIRKFSIPAQWHYVPTDLNPADLGSRSIPANAFLDTSWISPPVLLNEKFFSSTVKSTFELIYPDADNEIKTTAVTLNTSVEAKVKLKTHRFERFSKWSSAVRATARLIHVAHHFAYSGDTNQECRKWHICKGPPTIAEIIKAERLIIQCVQHEVYSQEIHNISKGLSPSKDSPLYQLNPIIDHNKLLRVGGRIARSNVTNEEQNPLIITKTIPSNDGKVRKVEVKVVKEGSARHYFRPINELVLLLPKKEDELLPPT
ncbi:uncharacterized protein WCC33_016681 [Rhinophrynus dorsalis]